MGYYAVFRGHDKVLNKVNMECKDCTKRYSGCHDHCEEYKKKKIAYRHTVSRLTTDWIATFRESKHAFYYHKNEIGGKSDQ